MHRLRQPAARFGLAHSFEALLNEPCCLVAGKTQQLGDHGHKRSSFFSLASPIFYRGIHCINILHLSALSLDMAAPRCLLVPFRQRKSYRTAYMQLNNCSGLPQKRENPYAYAKAVARCYKMQFYYHWPTVAHFAVLKRFKLLALGLVTLTVSTRQGESYMHCAVM